MSSLPRAPEQTAPLKSRWAAVLFMHHKAAHFTGDLHLPRAAEPVNGCFVTAREQAVCLPALPRRLDGAGCWRGKKHTSALLFWKDFTCKHQFWKALRVSSQMFSWAGACMEKLWGEELTDFPPPTHLGCGTGCEQVWFGELNETPGGEIDQEM